MEEEFIAAAEDGDLDEVRRLVFSGEVVDPNTADTASNGRTALHGASMNGHLPVVRQLVEKWRVDVEVEDRHGLTPLHLACWKGHQQVARCLVEKGQASIDDARDSAAHTPLHYACSNGSLELVEYLVNDRKADATIKTNMGETPLLIACARGFVNVVSFLLPHSPVDAKVVRLAWRRKFPWYLKMNIVGLFSQQRLGRPEGYFAKYPLHTLFQCPLPSEDAFLECLYGLFNSVSSTDEKGRLPLHVLLESARTTRNVSPHVVAELIRLERRAETARDPTTGFFPYQAIACITGSPNRNNHEWDETSEDEASDVRDDKDDNSVSDLSDSDEDSDDGSDSDEDGHLPRAFPQMVAYDLGSDWLDFMFCSIRRHDPSKLLATTR